MKWFYTLKNQVKGPYENDALEHALNRLGPDLASAFVWTRGKNEWTPADRWTRADAEKILLQFEKSSAGLNKESVGPAIKNKAVKPSAEDPLEVNSAAQSAIPKTQPKESAPPELKKTRQLNKPSGQISAPAEIIVPTDDEITRLFGNESEIKGDSKQTSVNANLTTEVNKELLASIQEKVSERFKVQYAGIEQPQMTKEELIQFTASQEDPAQILIYDRKLKDWKEIYTFPDIIEKLGLSRRQNRRVIILGQFKGSSPSQKEFLARLTTMSMGGFGLTDVFDLKVGDMVDGQIASPHFYTPLSIKAEVTYAGAHGNIGLKFTSINDEAKALVVDYIKKFGQGIKTEQN